MGRTVFKGAAVLLAVLILIQLVPVERSNPPVTGEISAPLPVMEVLRNSCYDCHSNETEWPWYSHVAPVSWLVVRHVTMGREQVNFSDWESLTDDDRDHAREEAWEEVEEGNMPHRGYLRWHPEARLTPDQMEILEEWARGPLGVDTPGRAPAPDA
jgi:hypothetical protein